MQAARSNTLTFVAYIKAQLVIDASRRLGGLHQRQAAGSNTSTSVAYIKTELDLGASCRNNTLTFIAYLKAQLVLEASRREKHFLICCVYKDAA